jgi:tetraacyldisaccharide 4'-kinase
MLIKRILSFLYGVIVTVRGFLYDKGYFKSYRSPLPVISVGNVTAGGNGKTPLCLALADELRKRGYTPAILSRGYGGSRKGPYRVKGSDSYREVGDEPVLMARAGTPVFIARKRVAGIKLIEQDQSINVVILDDGFQHRALSRVLDIVSVFVGSERAIEDFRGGALLPLGMFRESRDRALRRAQVIVLSSRSLDAAGKTKEVNPSVSALLPDSAAVFRSSLTLDGVRTLEGDRDVAPSQICAIAAIGNPDGFFSSLDSLGFVIRERFVFPDHHVFGEAEIREILGRFPELLFVCTAKDAVKLGDLPHELRQRFAVLSVKAQVYPADAFFVSVERAIQGYRLNARVDKVARI